jgi:hypothetical protein
LTLETYNISQFFRLVNADLNETLRKTFMQRRDLKKEPLDGRASKRWDSRPAMPALSSSGKKGFSAGFLYPGAEKKLI